MPDAGRHWEGEPEGLTLAFWECGYVEVDIGKTHPCDRDVCSATYRAFIPASAAVSVIQECEGYRSALEHIAQAVGARANGTDAKLMAKRAREALGVDHG